MTDEDLHDRLATLAAGVPVAPLRLPELARAARGRRRRQRLLAVSPLLAAALVVPVAATGLGDGGDDSVRIAQDGPPGAPVVAVESLSATVEAQVAADGETALVVSATDARLPLGDEPAEFTLTFLATGQEQASFRPFPRWSEAVPADAGEGLIGLAGPCGPGWGPTGQQLPDPCTAAEPVTATSPGVATNVPLRLYSRVGDRQAVPGTYRTVLVLDGGHDLGLLVTITETNPDSPADSGTAEAASGPLGSGACPQQPAGDPPGTEEVPAGFVPVELAVCWNDVRRLPGEGRWQVVIESRSRQDLDRISALLAEPNAPPQDTCPLGLPFIPRLALIDADGRTVWPRIPLTGCGAPLQPELQLLLTPERLTEVAVARIRQVESEEQAASGCQGYKNMIDADPPNDPNRAGPAFATRPTTLVACVYRTPQDDYTSPEFVRSQALSPEQTIRLLDELSAATEDSACATPSHVYAVLPDTAPQSVLVELGGCNRILRADGSRGRLARPSTVLAP